MFQKFHISQTRYGKASIFLKNFYLNDTIPKYSEIFFICGELPMDKVSGQNSSIRFCWEIEVLQENFSKPWISSQISIRVLILLGFL